MRHDIADLVLLILIFIFSFLGYEINKEVFNSQVESLELKISNLNNDLDSLKYSIDNKQDTVFIKVYNYNQKK